MIDHKILLRKTIVPLILFLTISGLWSQQSGAVPTRTEIEEQYTWDLKPLYHSDQDWETDFKKLDAKIKLFSNYGGQLGKSEQQLLECLQLKDQTGILMGRLSAYASRLRDQDLGNTTNQARAQRIQSLGTKLSNATAFIEPEILEINDRKLNQFKRKVKGLALYDFYLNDLRRVKAHILSRPEEELLSLSREATRGTGSAFGMLTNTDFKWGNILDENGQEVEMSRSRYYLYMSSSDRRLRHDAYKALYVPYQDHINTLTSLLISQLKTNIFYMKARKYDNSLAAALDGPNIPVEVYYNLIQTLNDNLEPLHRWAGLKKRVLEVDELHPYDTYAPLFPEVEKKYTYEEAQEIIKAALLPLGPEIREIINKAFSERWIDVYENAGKRGGAYSAGVYSVHPYILMNFNGTLNSVFTLAHELGHTMHSYLTTSSQPYIYSGYATFNAEVASTTNEALLRDYLLNHAESDAERLSLLQEYIQSIGSTFYRQGRFAEFELAIYQKAEKDEPLTYETLNQIFGELYSKYWGTAMVVDPEENMSWTRIPHFYYNYYVYAYATSFAASQMMAQKIATEGSPAVGKYLKFLSSGGSDYPIELLKIAGVDMSTPAPIEATTAKMNSLIDQVEAILAKN